MSGLPALGEMPDPVLLAAEIDELLEQGDVGACCAIAYEHPAIRWLLGDELHPGGEALTFRALDLLGLSAGHRLLDVAGGDGATAVLAAQRSGCRAAGIEYGAVGVERAKERIEAAGLKGRIEFVRGDAHRLPFPDGSFDAAISECAMCILADKPRVLAELRRVLVPGGAVAIADVVARVERLPEFFATALGTVACVGAALPPDAHRQLLVGSGFEVICEEDHSAAADAMASRLEDRLRGAKVLGLDRIAPIEGGIGAAIELVREARRAIGRGDLGYRLLVARSVSGTAAGEEGSSLL